jgi:beta-mannosidase
MNKTSLDGTWTLYYGEDDGTVPCDGAAARAAGYACISAEVPGNVELDLFRAGLAPDPLLFDHVLDFERYESYNWVFERTFRPDPGQADRQAVLILQGVNTFAAVWLNGICLGEADNMLIPHAFAVGGALKWQAVNVLTVAIRSSMNQARRMDYSAAVRGSEHCDEMTRLRMPPHCFGWDIMPRLLSAGLWRPVELVYQSGERLDDLYFYTHHLTDNQARLACVYTVQSDQVRLPLYRVQVEGRCGEHTFLADQTTHFISNSFMFTVDQPQLWWPRGYGEPNLYAITVTLWRDDQLLDRRELSFGIRTADVDMCFDLDRPQRFQVLINGRPIFVRGSNWVPLSALHSLDVGRVEQAIELASACGCNALRCWGGNVYESERFYDLCDRRGLLVWQDFAMACSGQPSDDAFARVIEREATWVVKTLRNHACLLLWAGDNEVDAVVYARYPRGYARHNRITREVLPRIIAAHDPMRAYLPSSPYMPETYEQARQGPEQHLWGPRDDFKGDFYRLNTALFASEIGYHGCPEADSLRQFIAPEQLWPFAGSRHWLIHNTEHPRYRRGYDRNELMAKQTAILFGAAPQDLADFIFASQASQAEAMKFFIEQFRMQKGHKTGLIWWNIQDGWPQISDAVVDYFGRAKLAWHIISRSQRDVQLMIGEYQAWRHRLIAVNDTFRPTSGTYRVWRGDTGATVAEGSFDLPADGTAELASFAVNPAEQALYLIEWQIGQDVFANHYVAGRYPYRLADFRCWMAQVAALSPRFDLPC